MLRRLPSLLLCLVMERARWPDLRERCIWSFISETYERQTERSLETARVQMCRFKRRLTAACTKTVIFTNVVPVQTSVSVVGLMRSLVADGDQQSILAHCHGSARPNRLQQQLHTHAGIHNSGSSIVPSRLLGVLQPPSMIRSSCAAQRPAKHTARAMLCQ